MNLDNLKTLIQCYEDNLELIYNSDHDELFKWRAVQHFRDVWYAPENEGLSFAQRFNKAKKKSSVLIDNSRVSSSNGVVKIAEVAEQEVEHLFFDVLLADDGGDIVTRQNNMDSFLEGMEALRVKYYPQCWKYKQDRHAASCYMCFFAPDDNFIYHYTEVEEFAKHIEYGIDIGSGESFRLDAYYKMCNEVIDVLSESTSLLDKQKKLIGTDEYYDDPELHLLAFNLIWCSNTYNFYKGMTHISKKESIKEYTLAQLREKERAEREAKINAILSEIADLESQMAPCAEIDLIGVQVTDKKTGDVGTIFFQNINTVKVKYETSEKTYIINKQYVARPRFEDDEEIVELFTEYAKMKEKVDSLKRELTRLQ